MMELHWLLIFAFVSIASADYPCVCNYNVQLEVFESMSEASSSVGDLYEFDCKEQLVGESTTAGWAAVAYEHKIGYVKTGDNTQIQTCQGDAPDEDKVTTSAVLTSSTSLPDTTTSLPVSQTAATVSTTVMPVSSTTSPKLTSTDAITTESTTPSTVPSTTTTSTTVVSSTSAPTPTSTFPDTSTTSKSTTKSTTVSTTMSTTSPTSTTSTPIASSTTTEMMTTSTASTTATSPTTTPSTTASTTTPYPTTTQPTIITGKTALCPVALQSFTARDGGILTQYDKSCYEIVPHRHSWTYAEGDCKTKGGHLLHIGNAEEQNYIYKFLKSNYNHNVWIGFTDKNREGEFEWASGDRVTYTNWLPHLGNHFDCAYLSPASGGYWSLNQCSTGSFYYNPHAYICQYEIDTTSPLSGNVSPHGDGNTHMCPSSVQHHASRYHGVLGQYGQGCYELLPRYTVTWSHGERLCQQEGGHLVHINNADEQSFIQEFMTKYLPDHSVWIGLNDRSNENSFQWSSGNPVTYTNWAADHTNNFVSHHQEDCAVFKPYQNGHWDDVTCGFDGLFGARGETHAIICQFKVTTSGPSVIG